MANAKAPNAAATAQRMRQQQSAAKGSGNVIAELRKDLAETRAEVRSLAESVATLQNAVISKDWNNERD